MPTIYEHAAMGRRPMSPARLFSLGLPARAVPTAGHRPFASYAGLSSSFARGLRRLESDRGGVKR